MSRKREIYEKGPDRESVERKFYDRLIGVNFISWVKPPEVLYRDGKWHMYARFEYQRVLKKELEST